MGVKARRGGGTRLARTAASPFASTCVQEVSISELGSVDPEGQVRKQLIGLKNDGDERRLNQGERGRRGGGIIQRSVSS